MKMVQRKGGEERGGNSREVREPSNQFDAWEELQRIEFDFYFIILFFLLIIVQIS